MIWKVTQFVNKGPLILGVRDEIEDFLIGEKIEAGECKPLGVNEVVKRVLEKNHPCSTHLNNLKDACDMKHWRGK